jgi:signal transduction histidine kinase
MSLKKLRSFFYSLSGRLAISYFLFFAVSSALLFGVLFYSVAQFLEQKDHDVLESKLLQYQEMIDTKGLQNLEQVNSNSKLHAQSARFLIYVKDAKQNILFSHLPEEIENFDLKDLQKALQDSALAKEKAYWFDIASKDGDEDAMEVYAAPLENGTTLYVGARTDDRDEILEKTQNIFVSLAIPLLLISIFGAFFFTKRALRPVRQLIATVSKIKDGDLSSRVSATDTQDELYELSILFNEMIERIDGLVTAMKDTLDNVAHDLKTPITRLKVAGELALRSKDPEQARLALVETIENCDEIHSLIKSIMTVSEISTHSAQLVKTTFDLKALIDEVIEVYFFVADDKSIWIQLLNREPLMISADRSLLKQAIANLLDNALKYSSANSAIEINYFAQADVCVFMIEDHGFGISEQDLPRIWERLYRGDKSRHEPGLGLGLNLVRAIVEAHAGHVSVQSQLAVGSIFKIEIPAGEM